MATVAVVNVKVYVVGVGLPVQHEAQRRRRLDGATGAGQARADVVGVRGIDAQPGGGGQPQVVGQDALDAAEAPRGIAARRAGGDGLEGRARMTLLQQREAQQAMAGGMIGPLLDGLAIGVDRQRQRRRRPHALEAFAGEPPHVGAPREQIDERAVRA